MTYVFFLILVVTFVILFVVNIFWALTNLYIFLIDGIEAVLTDTTLIENIYFSIYLRWILLLDIIWIVASLVFGLRRKSYKTDSKLHYLSYSPIVDPKICVFMPTFNEEESIEQVVKDFINQKFIKNVIVVDNNSQDDTVKIAEKAGANVIRKKENKGYSHSLVMGFKEALKTDCNIIATVEADGTFNAYDLDKMLPYLDNCDMVIGSRQNQVITEKDNQNSGFFVWANYCLAKLIQMKYISLRHMGIVNLTDVGCVYRIIKREKLTKIVEKLTYPKTDKPIGGEGIGLYLTMLGIENDLKIIEIPVTFNKRIGVSKISGISTKKMIKVGLNFLWIILIR
jgi:glycosyltransferase involved in cell wall biosynthesis